MHRPMLLSQGVDDVKTNIVTNYDADIERILEMASTGASTRELELTIWEVVLKSAQMSMSAALGLQCCRITEEDIRARGLSDDQVRLRNDDDYQITMMTTFGSVTFFSFAYRDSSSGVTTVTRTPAGAQVFPLHKHCHSSEVCLEWETKLGQEMPFRRAQRSLSHFTHGAVSLEDTTIEGHMMTVSRLVDRQWLYQTPEAIREVLLHRATRDLKTDKPLIYLSSDAHALRRFVDESWDARWKMANGLRLWCIDRHSSRIIHLGGEYTWGDCHQVGKIVDWLIDNGHVPVDGDYGEGLVAQIVLPTDGMPWIEDYVIKKFSADAVALLDPYHTVKHLKDYAAGRFGKNSAKARKFMQDALRLLLGPRREKKRTPRKTRRGSCKVQEIESDEKPYIFSSWEMCELAPPSVEVLVNRLLSEENVKDDEMEAHLNLIDYLDNNAYRMVTVQGGASAPALC